MFYNDDQIRRRILRLMHREGLTQVQFAEMIKKSQPSVSDLLRGKRSVTKAFIDAVTSSFTEIRENWLVYGDEPMYKGDDEAPLSIPADTRPRLPKTFSSGHIEDFLREHRSECQEKPIITQFAEYEFTIILKNDRMTPKYQRGDELAFRKASIIEWGNDYLLDTADGPKFKKVYRDKDKGVVKCVSYNKEVYPEFEIPEDEVLDYYRCVGVIRVL